MREIQVFGMDIVVDIIKGYLLCFMIQGVLPLRKWGGNSKNNHIFKRFDIRANVVRLIMIGQYVIVLRILQHAPFMQSVLYGEAPGIITTKPSIVVLVISMVISLAFIYFFYEGGELWKLCLVTAYYALAELIRFIIFSLLIRIFEWGVNRILDLYLQGKIVGEESYFQYMSALETAWNLFHYLCFLLLFYLLIKKYKQYLHMEGHILQRQEVYYLLVPNGIGLCFSVLLRLTMYYQRNEEIINLWAEEPGLYFLVPLIAGLCGATILFSAKTLQKVIREHQQTLLLNVYQNQIADMEEHIKDMDYLYDGIRGMKHDMKNYVADIEALLQEITPGQLPAGEDAGEDGTTGENGITIDGAAKERTVREELHGYLDGICSAMEQVDYEHQTGNPVTDVVINRIARKAKEQGIRFECDFLYPPDTHISAFDLSVLLNNGLENALEACMKEKQASLPQQASEQFMELTSYTKGNMFFLEICNSFYGILTTDSETELPMTNKEDAGQHGFGLKNIQKCAEKYYGKAECEVKNQTFLLTIMLQDTEKTVRAPL